MVILWITNYSGVNLGLTPNQSEIMKNHISCMMLFICLCSSNLTSADETSQKEPMYLLNLVTYRSDNCADHDNFKYKCQKFPSQGGLCNSYGLVHCSVLCFCVLCFDWVCHSKLFHQEGLCMGWQKRRPRKGKYFNSVHHVSQYVSLKLQDGIFGI